MNRTALGRSPLAALANVILMALLGGCNSGDEASSPSTDAAGTTSSIAARTSGQSAGTVTSPTPTACSASVSGGTAVRYPTDTSAYTVVNGLYQRPEGGTVSVVGSNDGVANSYVEPFVGALGGSYLLFYRGNHITLSGQGYFLLRWEYAYFNRGGVLGTDNAPSFQVQSGQLKRVALAGGHYMPDAGLDGALGQTGLWRPGFTAITAGNGTATELPSFWQNEYYYLDGTVTLTQRESGADYNVSVTPKAWTAVRDDLVGTQVYADSGGVRPGVSLDPYLGAHQPNSPVALSATVLSGTHVRLSWTDCSDNEDGFIVEHSHPTTVAGQSYAAGDLYAVSATLPANSQEVELGALQSGTTYTLRLKGYNAAGDSALSNVVQFTTPDNDTLAAPWARADVKPSGQTWTGSASQGRNGEIALNATSNDLWGNDDSFEFVYQALSGDMTLTARVIGMSYPHKFAKAGVMVRASLDSNAPYAMAQRQPNLVAHGQRRQASAGATFSEGSASLTPGQPYWLRLVRRGDTYTAQGSADGQAWTSLSQRTITLGDTVYAGLALATVGGSGRATFDQVSITRP